MSRRPKRKRSSHRGVKFETLESRVLLHAEGSLSGYVYLDADADGTRDESESGVPGIVVRLSDSGSVERSTLTDNQGFYNFEELEPGNYEVSERYSSALINGDNDRTESTTGVVLADDENSVENSFGKQGLRAQFINVRWFLSSTPPPQQMLRETVAMAEDLSGNSALAESIRAGGGAIPDDDHDAPDDVNARPSAMDDAYTIEENKELLVAVSSGVLANDTDPDDDTLTAILINQAANGSVTLSSDGSFTYTPNAGYEGADSFTYRITDGVADSTATATIIVSDSITTVTTAGDEYFIREDFVLSEDAEDGVLSNDMVSNGATLTATVVTEPANGTLVLNADGSFSYTPDPDFNGEDSFGYVASAGTASSTEQLVTILVQAVNDAPIGMDDSFQVAENQPLVIAVSALIANDSDPDGDAIMVTNVTQPSNGLMLFDEGDNSYAYQPFSNFTGEDSFTYIPNDVFTADDEPDQDRVVTVTIQVTSENGGAIATVADSYSVAEDTVLNESATTGLLANDTGDQLSSVVATQPANGMLTLQSDGSFTYTPNADFFGTDSFTYNATNGSETSAATTVQIQVEPVNDRPSAQPESYFVGVDTPLSVNTVDGILANDVDVDGDSIAALLIDDVSNGTLTLNEDGSFDYTPNSGFSGEETFTYIATDQTRDSSVTTVTITVGVSETEYVAVDNLYELREDGQLNIPVNFGVLVMDLNSPVGNTVAVETEPQFGTLTLNPDGSFVYMPQLNFTGDDMFTYRASAGGDNATATVTIRVSNREDAPIANDDAYMVEMGQVLTANVLNGVLANDTDGDGDFLTAVPLTDPASGSLDFNSDGTFTYTPESDFTGTVSFTYVARDDGGLLSEAATVTINVAAPPVAAAARPADSDSGAGETDLIDEAFADDDGLGDSLI